LPHPRRLRETNEQTQILVRGALLKWGGGHTDDTGEGRNAQLLCLGFAREHHGGCTIVEVGGIRRSDRPIGLKDRSESGNLVILDLFVLLILFDDRLAALLIEGKYQECKCKSDEGSGHED